MIGVGDPHKFILRWFGALWLVKQIVTAKCLKGAKPKFLNSIGSRDLNP